MLRILGAMLGLAMGVLLARLLGPDGYGLFYLCVTIVLIMATLGRMGMESPLIKFMASSEAEGRPEKIRSYYREAMRLSLLASLGATCFLYLSLPYVGQVFPEVAGLKSALAIMGLAIVPSALLVLLGRCLQGLKRIKESLLILAVVVPFFASLFIFFLVPEYGLEAALWSWLAANVLTLILALIFWRGAVTQIYSLTPIEINKTEFLASSMPMFAVILMNLLIVWLPTIILGMWVDASSLGIYSAANKVSLLMTFAQTAVNSIAAPKFAALYKQGDIDTLAAVAQKAARLLFLQALPFLLLLLFIPEIVLSLFGEEFTQGSVVLRILAFSQFINVMAGSVGYLLTMSGGERLMRSCLLASSIVCILLNFTLIPFYGLIGAAIASCITMATQMLIATVLVHQKLKIVVFPLWPKK